MADPYPDLRDMAAVFRDTPGPKSAIDKFVALKERTANLETELESVNRRLAALESQFRSLSAQRPHTDG